MSIRWIFAFCAAFCATATMAEPVNLSKLSTTQLAPYAWQSSPISKITIEDLQTAISEGNPQQVFYRAFNLLRVAAENNDSSAIARVADKLDAMMQPSVMTEVRGQARRWHYGYPFEGFQPGWRSGMDTFLGPLTFWLLADLTKNDEYRSIALATARLGTKSPPEGGVFWRDESGCWISEFADDSHTLEKETFVMNGHLYGLEALYLLASASSDRELMSAYECARRGTESRFNQYFMPQREWTYYQTNPRVVHPGHYALFEMSQFWSLYQLTGERFYKQAMEERSRVFAERFPLSLIKTNDAYDVIVSSIGVPNAYWPDNYGIDLSCQVGDETVRQTFVSAYAKAIPFADRLVPAMRVKGVPATCIYSVTRGDFSMPVYEQTKFQIQEEERAALNIPAQPSYDATESGSGKITLARSEKLQEGRISFDVNQDFGFNDIAVISLTPSDEAKTAILLYGQNGTYTHREYRNLIPGCENIIPFTKIGFNEHEKMEGKLTSVALRIATTALTAPSIVRNAHIDILRNAAQLKGYLRDKPDACINLQ